eukprot:403365073
MRSPEEKREAQKQRRLAKKDVPQMDGTEFKNVCIDTIQKYELAFTQLEAENPKGKLEVKRASPLELQVLIKSLGTYKFYVDEQEQQFFLQSPESGLHNYKWDGDNQQWKSISQVHFMEELLLREVTPKTNGMLTL